LIIKKGAPWPLKALYKVDIIDEDSSHTICPSFEFKASKAPKMTFLYKKLVFWYETIFIFYKGMSFTLRQIRICNGVQFFFINSVLNIFRICNTQQFLSWFSFHLIFFCLISVVLSNYNLKYWNETVFCHLNRESP